VPYLKANNRIKLIINVFSLILFISFSSYSSNNIILNGSENVATVFKKISFYTDSLGIIDYNKAYLKFLNNEFNQNCENIIANNQSAKEIWFACKILNSSETSENYIIQFPKWDTIKVFAYNNDSVTYKFTTGGSFNVDQKEIKDSRNLIKLNIKPSDEIILLIKISGKFSITKSYDIKFDISNEVSFYRSDSIERYFQGIFLGVIIIMVLYNLFLFLSIRHISYLYYVFMLLGSAFIWISNFRYQYEYFFTWIAPNTTTSYELFISAFFGVFLILFTKSFLDTKSKFKKWNIYLNILIIIIAVIPIMSFLFEPLSDICFFASFLSGILAFISILIVSIYTVIKKIRPARYFLLANIFFSSGTIIFILSNLKLIPNNYFTFHGMQFGNILEIALFSLALADRINILKKENEKNQQQIIHHLIENEKLKDKVNRELEKKVKERTAEINQQKEEIEAQRDEIESQRDLVTLQKNHIEEIHKEVTDSINYAKRIQEAVLPISISSREFLGEHFILFRPKDIVSGDFYWFYKVNNSLIYAVADCTGHGVPGAFMSMLGISFLNEIVRKNEIVIANEVLNELRKEIINALQQKGHSGEQKDGMDMSLIVINQPPKSSERLERSELYHAQWAGANNPLWLVRTVTQSSGLLFEPEVRDTDFPNLENLEEHMNQRFVLQEVKPDKMPIAIYEKMDSFTNHEIQLHSGDTLYLMSDGYQDQFGGPNGKKFLSKNLKQLILTNCQLPMEEQKLILEKTLDNWIGKGEQIDDITILGLKI